MAAAVGPAVGPTGFPYRTPGERAYYEWVRSMRGLLFAFEWWDLSDEARSEFEELARHPHQLELFGGGW